LSRTWFTSDYHMGHRNIIGLCSRPFEDVDEMEREIIARHNELVAPNDEVYDLGDFAYRCPPEHASDCLRRLNGRRTMLWGNHDEPLRQALRQGLLDDWVQSGRVTFVGDPEPSTVALFGLGLVVLALKRVREGCKG
jgi:calcineurin-like phosphoesterase family protein